MVAPSLIYVVICWGCNREHHPASTTLDQRHQIYSCFSKLDFGVVFGFMSKNLNTECEEFKLASEIQSVKEAASEHHIFNQIIIPLNLKSFIVPQFAKC